jgi:dTDP-4-dehydrorhamnose reductase
MRVLVIGANGMLGTDMLQDWKSDEGVAADREQADIRNIAQLRALISRVRPDWIVLTAAYINVDGSEKTKETPLSPSPGSHLPEPALGGLQ